MSLNIWFWSAIHHILVCPECSMDTSIVSDVLTQCELTIDLCIHNVIQVQYFRKGHLPYALEDHTDYTGPQNIGYAPWNCEWNDLSTICNYHTVALIIHTVC